MIIQISAYKEKLNYMGYMLELVVTVATDSPIFKMLYGEINVKYTTMDIS